MPLFGSTYGDDLSRARDRNLVGSDPYVSQLNVAPFVPMPSAGGGYLPERDPLAEGITGVGTGVTGVLNAYTTKKRLDADEAYRNRILDLLGSQQSPTAQKVPTAKMSIADQDPEMARALQHQTDQRYQAMSASSPSTPGSPTPAAPAPVTPTTPTGTSAMQLGGQPMTPTPPAPVAPDASVVPATPATQPQGAAADPGYLQMLLGLLGGGGGGAPVGATAAPAAQPAYAPSGGGAGY